MFDDGVIKFPATEVRSLVRGISEGNLMINLQPASRGIPRLKEMFIEEVCPTMELLSLRKMLRKLIPLGSAMSTLLKVI